MRWPERIAAEYVKRIEAYPEARWGWSFMYTPEASLVQAKAVLVGLNPGGSQIDPPNEWDYVYGKNAYIDESWQGLKPGEYPLQQQVALLFKAAGVAPDKVFAANFVPFRSRSWAELPGREEALAFSRDLWRYILSACPASLYFSLGKQAGGEIAALLKAALVRSHPVEWGKQTLDEYRSDDGRVVLALPHLSRYRLFGGSRTAAGKVVQTTAADLRLHT